MKILKYKGKGYDKGGKLFCVTFDCDGKELKWYPKWKDLGLIFRQGFITEHTLSNKKYLPYFKLICLEILMGITVRDELPHGSETWLKFEALMGELAEPFEKDKE